MAISCMRNEKLQYSRYCNSSVIVDLAMGQIPRSTERISSLFSLYIYYITITYIQVHHAPILLLIKCLKLITQIMI